MDFPVAYFEHGDVPTMCASEVSFRAARRATVRQREAATSAGVAGVEINQWVSVRFALPGLDLTTFDGYEPKTAAIALRTMWGLGAKSPPNLLQLCESRGIRVYTLPPFADAVDAYSIWRQDVPFIFLSRRKASEHIRFDLAHELGHLVLHSSEPAETAAHEREADVFASEFLMPEASVDEYLRFNPSVADILNMRSHFKVSAMAMTIATYRASRMSEWNYRQMCMTCPRRASVR